MVKLLGTWQAIKKKLPVTLGIIILAIVFSSVWWFFNRHKETIKEVKTEPSSHAVAHLNGISESHTTVSYVPKQVVDGTKEDTDVEVNVNTPKVVAMVNGQRQELALKQKETQKFEDGKVVVDQKSEITLDVKVPERHELNIYTDTVYRGDKFHYGIGIEKQNGKFKYGVHYDLKDKDTMVYARYDVIRTYSH